MQERDKHFSGTKSAYMKKRMPAALVKQLGHDHETLLENAVVDSKTDNILESDSFVVLLANKEIRDSHCKYSDDGDEEGEDSSDDELLWFLIPVIVTVNLFCELFICIEKLSDTRDAETSNVHE